MSSPGYKELKVYQKAYKAAMDIYQESKKFPKEEMYSLTDQIRRSSRSVCTNLGEGYRKRIYPKHFTSKMSDSDGECAETMIHLDFAMDCGYISNEKYNALTGEYLQIGKMLGAMITNPEKFAPRKLPTATAN
jgi:four helix bundle protein